VACAAALAVVAPGRGVPYLVAPSARTPIAYAKSKDEMYFFHGGISTPARPSALNWTLGCQFSHRFRCGSTATSATGFGLRRDNSSRPMGGLHRC
jgi:hypothetical protein